MPCPQSGNEITDTQQALVAAQNVQLHTSVRQLNTVMTAVASGSGQEISRQACDGLLQKALDAGDVFTVRSEVISYLGMAFLYAFSGGVQSDSNYDFKRKCIDRAAAEKTVPGLRDLFPVLLRDYADFVKLNGRLGRLPEDLRRVVDYVVRHSNEVMTLDILQAKLGIDAERVSARLREATGYSIPALVLHMKVVKAQGLLVSTERSITEIAYQLSFSSPNQFSTAFRRETGLTPRAYRQLYS